MKSPRILLLLLIASAVVAFFALDLGRYLNLEFLKVRQTALQATFAAHPVTSALVFFAIYVVTAALSLPGAALLSLAAGVIFGLLWGTVIVSFASTLGATLAFLGTRFLFRDAVRRHFGDRLQAINVGVEKDGAFYLFTLRLVPLFPFFLVNLLMGLTPLRTWTYCWVSQLGMLPGTLVYVNAGAQIAKIESIEGITSPELLLSFALLGVFPLIARNLVIWLKTRCVYRRWPRPKRFDRNLVVIGAGAAGLVSAYIAAAVKAKVTLIERHKMGGDCLNYGCVPSKALIRTARLLAQIKRAPEFGLRETHAEFDFTKVMERVRRVIRRIEPHDSVERYCALGVECIQGEARITSPWTVKVNGRTLTTRTIVIAAGAEPWVPEIPGLNQVGYLTSETVWDLRALPRRLLVLGGGPIGCELGQCFARLGAEVTLVQRLPRLLVREDDEVSDFIRARLEIDGVRALTDHHALRVEGMQSHKALVCEYDGAEVQLPFDALLVAVGRVPRTQGYGLDELGIDTSATRTVETNEYLQTIYPNIYACGDVAGPYQFTHTGAHQAWYAAVNALFGQFRKFRADYSVIPACTFTDPEVARVGLNEREAKQRNIPYEVTNFDIADLDRAITDEAAHGFIKVLTAPGKDRILGATVVGEHAGEVLAEFVLAMRHRLGLNQILSTIHSYPTFAEANKYAAGVWKKAHAPEGLLRWIARYHAWRLH